MFKQHKTKLLVFLPIIALSSCGYRIPDLVDGDMYNSPIFEKNYYRVHDDKLSGAIQGKIVALDDETDKVITKYEDLKKLDPQAATVHEYSVTEYGQHYNMSSIDSSFKYGYLSKLYNGAMVCGGRYQLSRVQIDEKGFSQKFLKESSNSKPLDYFAMSLRASTDNPDPCLSLSEPTTPKKHSDSELYHDSYVNLTVSIYTKDGNNILKNDFSYLLPFDGNMTNRGSGGWSPSTYHFFGFSLAQYNLTRVVGIGMNYSYIDPLVELNKANNINMQYSLMLYEVFLPYSEWN